MAEDLEKFSRKRDTACDGNSRHKGPTRVCIPTQLIMKQVSKYDEPKCVTCDVEELIPGEREILKGNPTNLFPVWVANEIVQREERRNCQQNE